MLLCHLLNAYPLLYKALMGISCDSYSLTAYSIFYLISMWVFSCLIGLAFLALLFIVCDVRRQRRGIVVWKHGGEMFFMYVNEHVHR
ncbi:hypothetical protein RJT34_11368 [Clitoria ternatea]|uniref:Uncharacterized protein n=1 Tax=Clitoria ternatea TaxID=43366 RepID=A0AAN9JK00_CLITE